MKNISSVLGASATLGSSENKPNAQLHAQRLRNLIIAIENFDATVEDYIFYFHLWYNKRWGSVPTSATASDSI